MQFSPNLAKAGQYDNAVLKANYIAYCGDFNGDGQLDVLIRAQPAILTLPLDDDFTIPIVLAASSPSFALISTGTSYSLNASIDASILNHPTWHDGCHQMIYGDVLGTGAGSVLLKGLGPGTPSFLVAMSAETGTLRLVQQITLGAVGTDISSTNTTVELRDQNGDGRSDLYISVNNRLQAVALADAMGVFHINTERTVIATWQAMLGALDSHNVDGALSYIALGSRDKYGQAFNGLGPSTSEISPTLSDFALSSITSRYAVATISRNYNGTSSLHYVTFIFTGENWEILEF